MANDLSQLNFFWINLKERLSLYLMLMRNVNWGNVWRARIKIFGQAQFSRIQRFCKVKNLGGIVGSLFMRRKVSNKANLAHRGTQSL